MDTYSSITSPVDKERVHDLLLTQKHLTDSYNTFANEASNRNLQQDLLTILSNEHDMEFKVFEEMQRRGWYSVEYVDQADIDKVKQSYNKMT
jgi:spore coat protein CotF